LGSWCPELAVSPMSDIKLSLAREEDNGEGGEAPRERRLS
jgi:hypothetical protein